MYSTFSGYLEVSLISGSKRCSRLKKRLQGEDQRRLDSSNNEQVKALTVQSRRVLKRSFGIPTADSPDLLAKWSKAVSQFGEVHWVLGCVGIGSIDLDVVSLSCKPHKWIHEHHLDVEINVAGRLQDYVLKVNTNLPVLRRHSGSIGWIKRTLVDLVR